MSGTAARVGSSGASHRASLVRSFSRSTGNSSGGGENLPPRTLARVGKEVRNLMQKSPEGVRLVVDPETGMPGSLAELQVSLDVLHRINDGLEYSRCYQHQRQTPKSAQRNRFSLRWSYTDIDVSRTVGS